MILQWEYLLNLPKVVFKCDLVTLKNIIFSYLYSVYLLHWSSTIISVDDITKIIRHVRRSIKKRVSQSDLIQIQVTSGISMSLWKGKGGGWHHN